MPLSREEVEKVALLGRLRLTPQELDTMTAQLSAVVGYIEQLSELNTDDVEPMAHAVELSNVFRADEINQAWIAPPRWQMLRGTTTSAIWYQRC